jgi:hypothetical protein
MRKYQFAAGVFVATIASSVLASSSFDASSPSHTSQEIIQAVSPMPMRHDEDHKEKKEFFVLEENRAVATSGTMLILPPLSLMPRAFSGEV